MILFILLTYTAYTYIHAYFYIKLIWAVSLFLLFLIKFHGLLLFFGVFIINYIIMEVSEVYI